MAGTQLKHFALVIIFLLTGATATETCNEQSARSCARHLMNGFYDASTSTDRTKACRAVNITNQCLDAAGPACTSVSNIISTNFDDVCNTDRQVNMMDCTTEKKDLDECVKATGNIWTGNMTEDCIMFGHWKECMESFVDVQCRNDFDKAGAKAMIAYEFEVMEPLCKKLGYPINASYGLQPAVTLLGAILVVFSGLI